MRPGVGKKNQRKIVSLTPNFPLTRVVTSVRCLCNWPKNYVSVVGPTRGTLCAKSWSLEMVSYSENAQAHEGDVGLKSGVRHEARKRRTLRRVMMTPFQGPALSRLGDKENRFQ